MKPDPIIQRTREPRSQRRSHPLVFLFFWALFATTIGLIAAHLLHK